MYPNYGNFPLPWQSYQPRPTLPPQQITTVSGADSIGNLQMAPNSSILVMDQSAPVVYLCQSDGVGKVTSTAYDITPHKDPAIAHQESIDARISALESAVKKLEGLKHEPDVPVSDG